MYYLTVSVLGVWPSWVPGLDFSIGCNQGLGWGVVISRYTWGRTHFQVHVVVGWIKFLIGRWTEGLSSSLAVGQKPHSVSCHIRSRTWRLASWEHARWEGNTEILPVWKSQSLIPYRESDIHHFCNTLVVGSKSIQGRGLHRAWKPGQGSQCRPSWESACHTVIAQVCSALTYVEGARGAAIPEHFLIICEETISEKIHRPPFIWHNIHSSLMRHIPHWLTGNNMVKSLLSFLLLLISVLSLV